MDYLQYLSYVPGVIPPAGILNLMINGLPSIHIEKDLNEKGYYVILNLIINGLPSILLLLQYIQIL